MATSTDQRVVFMLATVVVVTFVLAVFALVASVLAAFVVAVAAVVVIATGDQDVVPRVERATETALAEQRPHRRPLVRVDRRTELEHLPAPARLQPGSLGPLGIGCF